MAAPFFIFYTVLSLFFTSIYLPLIVFIYQYLCLYLPFLVILSSISNRGKPHQTIPQMWCGLTAPKSDCGLLWSENRTSDLACWKWSRPPKPHHAHPYSWLMRMPPHLRRLKRLLCHYLLYLSPPPMSMRHFVISHDF